MRCGPPRIKGGCIRKSPGLIQPRAFQTLYVPTFWWWMNHHNDYFHCWHCALGSCKPYLLPCSNGIPLQDFNLLHLQISNNVAYNDLENGRLAIAHKQVYMLHKCLGGTVKVPSFFHHHFGDQFRSSSLDLQWLKLWVLSTAHSCMAYDKLQWMIDHWMIKSTQHSLPSLRLQCIVVCRPGT